MKNVRLLCLVAMLFSIYAGARTYLHERRSPHFNLSKVSAELHAIEERDRLMERVDVLLKTLEKSDERIHDWRALTARVWGQTAFILAMVLVGTFVWNRETALRRRVEELQRWLIAEQSHDEADSEDEDDS